MLKLVIAGLALLISTASFASNGGKEEPITDYIDLERMTINISGKGHPKHLILNAQIELRHIPDSLPDEEKEKLQTSLTQTRLVINDYMPVLKHEFIFLFRSQSYEELNSSAGVKSLKEKATHTVKNLLEHHGGHAEDVKRVLFPNFVMQ
jgi:flagellar basal body-associated protein FliL